MADDQAPVFSPTGQMQGNLTSSQGQPPAAVDQLSPQSALDKFGPPPTPPAPPNYPKLNVPRMPSPPTQQQLGPAPDARDYQKGAMEFASAMAVLGAVAGRFTRQPGGAALGAFGAAVNGWQSGNLLAYENAAKKWEADTKATIDNNRTVMEQYKLALENRRMSIDEQMSQIQLTAAKYHDDMMYNAAASKNYTLVASIYEKNQEFTAKLAESRDILKQRGDEIRQKAHENGAYWLSPEGQAEYGKLSITQKAAVDQLIDVYKIKAEGLKPGSPAEIITRKNAERAAQNPPLPPLTSDEEISELSRMKPAKSGPALAMQKFMEKHPEADEKAITQFAATYAGAVSRARTLGTRGANIDVSLDEAKSAAKMALARSDEVPRGNWVPLTELQQAMARRGSDPALQRFSVANAALITAYSQTMSRTGVNTVEAQKRATEQLSIATGPEAYKAGVQQLLQEMDIVQQAVHDVEGGGGTATAPAGGAPAAPAAGGWGKAEVVK